MDSPLQMKRFQPSVGRKARRSPVRKNSTNSGHEKKVAVRS